MWSSAPCSSPFSSALRAPCLLIIQFFFFCMVGVSLSRGLCWLIPRVAVGVPNATYLLTCWSVSHKQFWSWHPVAVEPFCFLSVPWHGEALYRLSVQGVCFFLVVFFLPSVAPASQQDFWFMELMLSTSSLCHLGSFCSFFFNSYFCYTCMLVYINFLYPRWHSFLYTRVWSSDTSM
jgi:hypothetical protein